ncbi:hypothetical protein JZ751_010055 [Albula glossodonta]|uniref:Uncharacterized protein n=1 Tax=Albula glossodonta TaxID=121402 RepID=A0A8T2MT80_9TELE|nr:hypothetical protein JZ751_010055 [Albula glossodonta]
MAVSVARDLSVTVSDHTMDKLAERQQALREGIQKGEPKVLGVSQLMVGVTVISYSLPLLSTDFTEVMAFGVPWWSGIMLRMPETLLSKLRMPVTLLSQLRMPVTLLSQLRIPVTLLSQLRIPVTLLSQLHMPVTPLSQLRMPLTLRPRLCVCLSTTAASLLVSLIALIFYFVDLENNPSKACIEPSCMAEHHSIVNSKPAYSSHSYYRGACGIQLTNHCCSYSPLWASTHQMPGHNTTVKPGGSSKIPWVGFGSWASNPTGLQDQLPGRALSVYLLARLIIRTDSLNPREIRRAERGLVCD